MYRLDGKVAFVTGSATGIGRAIAARLAEEGSDVALPDVNVTEAEKTATMIRKAGRRAEVVRVDVGEFAEVDHAIHRLAAAFGKIDILVNNAGIIRLGTVADTSLKEWRDIFRVNVDGVFHCCKLAVPFMVPRNAGKIINTASWFGKVGKPHYGAYCASKFAVIGLTQSLGAEMAPHRINVNAVCPGTIVETGIRQETDSESIRQGLPTAKQREHLIPLGRLGLPDDIARIVAFLASAESDYMTGQAINVTGGLWMH
jgi:NAD(P)-dependent dehydrogenase (short-subunit alcohol dehydrogenase family)